MNQTRIRYLVTEGRFEFSAHALRRVVERDISEIEIREGGRTLEIIEEYPSDKYSPSCLCLGLTSGGRLLHLQVCFSTPDMLKIITIYEPDPADWIDGRIRRAK